MKQAKKKKEAPECYTPPVQSIESAITLLSPEAQARARDLQSKIDALVLIPLMDLDMYRKDDLAYTLLPDMIKLLQPSEDPSWDACSRLPLALSKAYECISKNSSCGSQPAASSSKINGRVLIWISMAFKTVTPGRRYVNDGKKRLEGAQAILIMDLLRSELPDKVIRSTLSLMEDFKMDLPFLRELLSVGRNFTQFRTAISAPFINLLPPQIMQACFTVIEGVLSFLNPHSFSDEMAKEVRSLIE